MDSGVIQSIEEYIDGYLAYEVWGLNLDVWVAFDFIDGYDPFGFLSYAFRGNDWLYGNDFADVLSGYGGNDSVYGYGGDDTVAGGNGKDKLYSGAGYDAFYILGKPKASNVDQIKDYNDWYDQIWLDADWYDLPAGRLARKYFHVGPHAHDRNDRIVYDKAAGELLYDPNGNASGGEVVIATIGKNIGGLAASDFWVV